MRIPRRIAELLTELAPNYYGFLNDELECQGAKYHSPTPLHVREVNIGGKKVPLCGTCQDNLNVYQELKKRTPDGVPWKVRREFGNRLRQIGEVSE